MLLKQDSDRGPVRSVKVSLKSQLSENWMLVVGQFDGLLSMVDISWLYHKNVCMSECVSKSVSLHSSNSVLSVQSLAPLEY